MQHGKPYESHRCGAQKKDGTPCRSSAMANGRCRIHGGLTPSGIASPHFVHGRYSKVIDGKLSERYHEAMHDRNLLSLRSEIALTDTRISGLLEDVDHGDPGARWLELKELFTTLTLAINEHNVNVGANIFDQISQIINGGVNDFQAWDQIREMMEQRRKLVDTERKRLVDMRQMITTEQAMALITGISTILREEVDDLNVLSRIQSRLNGLTSGRTVATTYTE